MDDARRDLGESGFESAPARLGLPEWYPEMLSSITDQVSQGRSRAVRAANQELVATYWAVGRELLARESHEGWGAKVVVRLSADLKEAFPEAKGFSPRNLRYMKSFAAAWPDEAMLQRSVATLPWRHHVALLEKLDDAEARLWYAIAATAEGWSRDVLVQRIESRLIDRAGRATTNFARALPRADSDMAQQAKRDPYVFDFVGIADLRAERDVESALVTHLRKFLLELGQGFAFVGEQVRLTIGDDSFYADLLFYNFRLRRFVVIELKAGKFDPAYLGQLGMYMAAVDDLMAHPDDQPTIGLVLCKSKNGVVAEYALRGYSAPIGVAEWQAQIADSLPAELTTALPTVEEIEAELAPQGIVNQGERDSEGTHQ